MTHTPVEVLKKARRIIARRRFAQGDAVFRRGATCSALAIWSAAKNIDIGIEMSAIAFVKQAAGTKHRFLSHWHDAPGRTKEQVLRVFDKAIALASSP